MNGLRFVQEGTLSDFISANDTEMNDQDFYRWRAQECAKKAEEYRTLIHTPEEIRSKCVEHYRILSAAYAQMAQQ